nr:MAG TPA: hypothetical protein [Caudoviricetes sp.]
MKLKEYVPIYADLFARFNRHDLHNYINFVRKNRKYNSLENFILWDLYRRLKRADNFALSDEIYTKYPDVNDKHILTMLKAAFKMCFGYDVETFSYTTL